MPQPEAERLDALCQLALQLGGDASCAQELGCAWHEPEKYVEEYATRLSDRGIDAPIPNLAFIALIDALCERKRCIEIDWKTDPAELVKTVRSLLHGFGRKGWKPPKLADAETEDALRLIGSNLEAAGLTLATLDHASDSYSLVLIPHQQLAAALKLAWIADVGRLVVWRVPDPNEAQPEALQLHAVAAVDVEFSEAPRQFFALPGRRAVSFDGRALCVWSVDSAVDTIELDTTLLPDYEPNAAEPQHALVRSADAFGLVSRRFVRIWSSAGDSVLYENTPALEPNQRGGYPVAAVGGSSDDPNVVIAIFHRALAEAERIHPVVLRLDANAKTASFDLLNRQGRLGYADRDRLPMSSVLRMAVHLRRTPRLACIAWLNDWPYIVATGSEQNSPSYAVFARYFAPFGHLEQLIDLGAECTCRVSSSGAHLFVTSPERKNACAIFSLTPPSRASRTLELPSGASLLDHDAGDFWYFEQAGARGRLVVATLEDPK